MPVKKSYGRQTVQLQFQLAIEGRSPYWSIVKYYQGIEKEKARQMLLEAAWQYWFPFALVEGETPEGKEQGQGEARQAIYWLQHQINFLESQFEVEVGKSERVKPLGCQGKEVAHFRFRYQLRAQQEKLIQLIQYLMDVPDSFALAQKLLSSSLAYWGAIADRELGLLNEKGLNQSAANCIIRLRQHIAYLEEAFQLKERPESPVIAVPAGWGMTGVHREQLNQEEKANESMEVKQGETPDEDEEIKRLLRGNPKNDRLIEKMFDN
jgi:hypothetical protein